MTRTQYTTGLHELGDGCHAYLQPDGGWGWSNAGLVVGDGESTLVDTLFDLHLTAEMLSAMEPMTGDAARLTAAGALTVGAVSDAEIIVWQSDHGAAR